MLNLCSHGIQLKGIAEVMLATTENAVKSLWYSAITYLQRLLKLSKGIKVKGTQASIRGGGDSSVVRAPDS